MPERIYTMDGSSFEVPTPEEQAAVQRAVDRAEQNLLRSMTLAGIDPSDGELGIVHVTVDSLMSGALKINNDGKLTMSDVMAATAQAERLKAEKLRQAERRFDQLKSMMVEAEFRHDAFRQHLDKVRPQLHRYWPVAIVHVPEAVQREQGWVWDTRSSHRIGGGAYTAVQVEHPGTGLWSLVLRPVGKTNHLQGEEFELDIYEPDQNGHRAQELVELSGYTVLDWFDGDDWVHVPNNFRDIEMRITR